MHLKIFSIHKINKISFHLYYPEFGEEAAEGG